jgi:hypothetical protein
MDFTDCDMDDEKKRAMNERILSAGVYNKQKPRGKIPTRSDISLG